MTDCLKKRLSKRPLSCSITPWSYRRKQSETKRSQTKHQQHNTAHRHYSVRLRSPEIFALTLILNCRRAPALALPFTRIITVALILPHRPRSSTSHFGLSFLHPNPSPKSKSLVLIARSIFFSQTSDSYSHSPPCSTSGYSM